MVPDSTFGRTSEKAPFCPHPVIKGAAHQQEFNLDLDSGFSAGKLLCCWFQPLLEATGRFRPPPPLRSPWLTQLEFFYVGAPEVFCHHPLLPGKCYVTLGGQVCETGVQAKL